MFLTAFQEKQVLKDYLLTLMELCDGALLEAAQESADEQKRIYFQQRLLGLGCLHSTGIMHRSQS